MEHTLSLNLFYVSINSLLVLCYENGNTLDDFYMVFMFVYGSRMQFPGI